MTDSELIEHMHARGWSVGTIDVPMIREACKALAGEQNPWRQAVDDALIAHALDYSGPGDDPKEKVKELLEWAVTIATDPRVSETAAREQEASATGAEMAGLIERWESAGSKPSGHDRYLQGFRDSMLCAAQELRDKLATPTTSTTGKVDADEAFEELYKVSSRDPSNREDLSIWRAAWVAGQRALPGPVDASRVRECCGSPMDDKPACGSRNGKCETQAAARARDEPTDQQIAKAIRDAGMRWADDRGAATEAEFVGHAVRRLFAGQQSGQQAEPTEGQLEAAIREFGKYCVVYPATWIALRAVLALAGQQSERPAWQEAQEIAALIVRDVCESEAADPDKPDTVCVNVNELAAMIVNHLPAPAGPAEGEGA